MERFFTEHHVLRDRDPDELDRAPSDSEASDEEEEITDRVHSVHDPTGPWRQTPADNPSTWGLTTKKPRGRFFRSEHTGPKGVLSDYKAHKRFQREERERKEIERQMTLLRIAKGSTSTTRDEPAAMAACDADINCNCDDMLLDDEFLHKYNAMRMYELHEAATKRRRFGELEFINPAKYVEITDNSPEDVMMVVHLYDPESYPCGLVNQHLEQIASEAVHVKFVALIAREADDSISSRDVPILLIYRGPKLVETLVNLSDMVDGEFTVERIRKLVNCYVTTTA